MAISELRVIGPILFPKPSRLVLEGDGIRAEGIVTTTFIPYSRITSVEASGFRQRIKVETGAKTHVFKVSPFSMSRTGEFVAELNRRIAETH